MDDGSSAIESGHKKEAMGESRVELNYQNVEVFAKNYSSLLSAMGTEKYKAFEWGEGLNGWPSGLKQAIEKISPKEAKYSAGEYIEDEEIKKRLFLEQNLTDGVKIVFVIDPDKSVPHVYGLENLYVMGAEGKTVDLMEEVDDEVRSYFSPLGICGYEYSTRSLIFGDLKWTSKELGLNMGIPVYLHEIGHWYDAQINEAVIGREMRSKVMKESLPLILVALQKQFGSIEGSQNGLIQKVLDYSDEITQAVLARERNASNYAAVYMVNKRDEGIDLAPDRPGATFFVQLEKAFQDYERLLLGKEPELMIEALTEISPDRPITRELEAQVALQRVLGKR